MNKLTLTVLGYVNKPTYSWRITSSTLGVSHDVKQFDGLFDERIRTLKKPKRKFETKPASSNLKRVRLTRTFRVKDAKDSENYTSTKAISQNSEWVSFRKIKDNEEIVEKKFVPFTLKLNVNKHTFKIPLNVQEIKYGTAKGFVVDLVHHKYYYSETSILLTRVLLTPRIY